MRRTTRTGSFFLVYCLNIVLNIHLTIPGWILLILSFIIPQYIRWWYGAVYLAAFLLYILIWMLIARALGRWVSTAKPAQPIENKNPYSVRAYSGKTGWTPDCEISNINPYSVQENPTVHPGGTEEKP